MTKFIMKGLVLDDNIWTSPKTHITYYFRHPMYNEPTVILNKEDIKLMKDNPEQFVEFGIKKKIKKKLTKKKPRRSKKKSKK